MFPESPVYKRRFAVRYAAYGNLFCLVIFSPYCIAKIMQLPSLANSVSGISGNASFTYFGMVLWACVGYLLLLTNVILLFTSKKELLLQSNLRRVGYVGMVPLAIFALAIKAPMLIVLIIIAFAFQIWLSHRIFDRVR